MTDLLATCAATQSDRESSLNEVRQVHAKEIAGLQQAAADLLQELSSLKQTSNVANMESKSAGLGPPDSTITNSPMDGNRVTGIHPTVVPYDNISGV